MISNMKCYILIIIIISFFDVFNNYSKVQCVQVCGGYSCREGETAEKRFLDEEDSILKNIEGLENKVKDAKDHLSATNTAATLAPRKSLNIFKQLAHYAKKAGRIMLDLLYITKRDHRKRKLKREENKISDEPLITGWWPDGEKICTKAFNHNYFKSVKKWTLVTKDKQTKSGKKKWIRVQTAYQPERRKIWRTSKVCMAQSNKRTFPVYISAAEGYSGGWMGYKIFVFTDTPWSEKDFFNKFIFFRQTVVKVEAYLW